MLKMLNAERNKKSKSTFGRNPIRKMIDNYRFIVHIHLLHHLCIVENN